MATVTLKGALLRFVIDYAKALPDLYREVMNPLNEVSNLGGLQGLEERYRFGRKLRQVLNIKRVDDKLLALSVPGRRFFGSALRLSSNC